MMSMMSNEEEGGKSVTQNRSENRNNNRGGSALAFSLVVTMLGILFVLVLFLLWSPLSFLSGIKDTKDLIEFYKWALSVLLGAFGAWIGAGAAYFFGKENLKESSASTERAMEIQQKSLRRSFGIERVKDITLTAMNPNFIFYADSTKINVKQKLDEYKGYWFVPVVDKITGVLEDIIHAQVFWDAAFKEDKTSVKDIITEMDKTEPFKKLHGDLFYVKVSSNDKISDVYNLISNKGAEVAIVVDEKGKASHCVTKTELRTFLNVRDNN
jgi:predicted transcriptional regulator